MKTYCRFARKHNLCISVAGTGHDLLNRHSNNQGIMIRMNMMDTIEFDVNDEKGFGHDQGSVKLGPGVVFGQIQNAAGAIGKVISSGW